MKIYSFYILLLAVGLMACNPEGPSDEVPPNPFDAIEYPDTTVTITPPDSNSLVGLHQFIFSQSCAVPGCHDGSFEPDFRTVQSTYSTLVYQPVVKNTQTQDYVYRVVPGNSAESWIYNRVTTEDQILGRMPLYDNPLTSGQIAALKSWIDDGAPDMFGNISSQPNTQPQLVGLAAFQSFAVLGEVRVDTFRNRPSEPFGCKTGLPLTIWFGLEDDSTAIGQLENFRVQFATGLDNFVQFNPELERNAQFVSGGKFVQDFYEEGRGETFYWKVDFNATTFPINEVTWMRLLLNDGDHSEDFIVPTDASPDAYKGYMALFVVP
ncbi:MAG: hypothetical protein AAFQ83_04165 [Bacteroidota bacterium]